VGYTAHDLLIERRPHLPAWLKVSRYMLTSATCFAISEVVLIALFWSHLLGARSASIVASIAGIIPGYKLNRTWIAGRSHRSRFWREIAPYWATSLSIALLAAIVTGAANALFYSEPRGTRTIINAAAFMLTYATTLTFKYLLFHRVLFRPPVPLAERVSEARANTGQPVDEASGAVSSS
jgi:putative flippase GtrA